MVFKFLGPLVILCLFLFAKNHFADVEQIDILLCPYDMGDANAIKKLAQELEKEELVFKILPLGKAEEVFEKSPHLIKANFPNTASDREKTLTSDQLKFIKNSVKPKIVIAGMASATQAQILNLLKKEKAYTVAFYDNFDSPEGKEYIQPFLKKSEKIDEYFLPSQTTLSGFQNLDKTKYSKLSVLGQPVLEDWDEIFSNTNRDGLRKHLSMLPEDQLILFVGGYDDTYKEYFRLFVKAMKAFKNNPSITILVTYHPKTDGSLERSIVEEEKADNVKVVDKHGPSTAVVATVANVLCCHKSSVGILALYVGLPVIYVAKKGEINNFAIKQGLAFEVDDATELVETIKRILAASNKNQTKTKNIGIPKDSTKNTIKRIKEILISK